MKMREVIKTLTFVSLILIIVAVIGCGGVTPVENPFIKVTSPKEGDVIDGKDGYIEVEWVANDLRTNYVHVCFICAYYSKDDRGGTQIGDCEEIGLDIPAGDGSFAFGPNVASWILDTFGVVPDICQIRVMETVPSDSPGFEWVYDYSGVFTVTFD